MTKLYILFFVLLVTCSCNDNNKREHDKMLIQHNELNHKVERLQQKVKALDIELSNCKMNYQALDDATSPSSAISQ